MFMQKFCDDTDKNRKAMKEQLNKMGFKDADQIKDFDYVIPELDYLFRVHNGHYQYVSLIHYQGAFCEAVCEEWVGVKNTRVPKNIKPEDAVKRGFMAKRLALARSWPEIEKFVNLT
jgi:hypothetical protein